MALQALEELRLLLEPEVNEQPEISAEQALAVKLQQLAKLPSCSEVKAKLNNLAMKIAEVGPVARTEVIEAGGYQVIVSAWKLYCATGEDRVRVFWKDAVIIREATLNALAKLTPGFPEIVDEWGFVMIFQALDNRIPESTQIEALKLMRNICIKSEKNREALAMEYSAVEPFVHVIKVDKPSNTLVHEWCCALRALILNDDRRVTYNRAAERKRMVYQQGALPYLGNFINLFFDVPTLNSIVNAIGIMASHEDFCVEIESAGAVHGLKRILTQYPTNTNLLKNTVSCIRYLNISPIVREKMSNYNVLLEVLGVAARNLGEADLLQVCMSCLAFMTLRSPCSVAQLLVESGSKLILQIMRKYIDLDNPFILKGCCLTLRNIAAHGGSVGRATIIDLHAELLLREILTKYETMAENHVKPVLRDLGFEVAPSPNTHQYVPDNSDARNQRLSIDVTPDTNA